MLQNNLRKFPERNLLRTLCITLLALAGLYITSPATQARVPQEATAPSQTVTLSLDDVNVQPGTTDTLQMSLNNASGPAVFAGQITIDYDSTIGLTLTNAQTTNRTNGFTVQLSQPNANQAQIIFYHTGGQTIAAGSGPIMEIDYTVSGSASNGDSTDLTFSESLLSNASGVSVNTNVDNGSLTIGNTTAGAAKIYVDPASATMNVGDTRTLQIMIAPGSSDVNGVQVNAKVDPTKLKIVSVQNNTSQLTSVLQAATFDANAGTFSYSAGLLNGTTVGSTFEILQIEVEALATTSASGTPIEFLSSFPPTDISGPTGSVMSAADNGTVIISTAITDATLVGEIGLQGRPNGASQSKAVPVTVELFSSGGTTAVSTFNVTLDQNGRFTQGGITPGTYDVRMVNDHTLASKAQNVVLNAGNNNVYLGPLMEGDVNQDNQILVADFGLLSGAYNLCSNDSGFDDQTDLNEDNCTDLDDFGLLSGNYNTPGDITYNVNNPPPLPIELATAVMIMQTDNVSTKQPGDTIKVYLSVEPNGSKVKGATTHMRFDPAALEVTDVKLLAEDVLPSLLQESQINNNVGTVSFSQGTLGDAITEPFQLAEITMVVKQTTTIDSIGFTDAFPATNVTGSQGSVMAAILVEDEVSVPDGPTGASPKFLYLPLITK